MYRALWRVLPGPVWVKVGELIVLVAGLIVLLFTVVYPYIAQTFLLEQSTVGS